MLNESEKNKLKVIEKLVNKQITRTDASLKLNCSLRQIDRLVNKYKIEGKEGFIHKSRGTKNFRKTEEEKIEYAKELYLTNYSYFNFTHFYEKAKEEIGISYSVMYKAFVKDGILSTMAQRKTVANYNVAMAKAIQENTATEEQVQLFEQRKEEEKRRHIRRSNIHLAFGEDVQMDATFGLWFGDEVYALHLAVDRATRTVLAGSFNDQEYTRDYMELLMTVVKKFGIPEKIKTDRRGSFSINTNRKQKSNLNTTQFGMICHDLNVSLDSRSDPLFKPNVERLNKTFKNRLIAELKFHGITEKKEATEYLNNVFIPDMNKHFSLGIDPDKNVMGTCDYTDEELNTIISERFKRKIDNASSFKFNGKIYIPVDIETGELKCYSKGTICTVIVAFDYSLWCIVDNTLHSVLEVEQKQKVIPLKASKSQEEINKSKAHKPSANHPWRNYNKN